MYYNIGVVKRGNKMNNYKVTFNLKEGIDMISLAKMVQTNVYWNRKFVVDGDECSYRDFWDVAEDALIDGAVTVTITDEDEVIFA